MFKINLKEKRKYTKETRDYENWPGIFENGQNEFLEWRIIEFISSIEGIK